MRKLVLTIAALFVAATLSAQAPAYYGVRLFMLAPSQVPTPVAGQYTLFIDTTNGNQVSAKMSNGSVYSIEGVGGGASDFTDLTGTATDAQIPNNITITLAAAATALAANGGNCSGNNFALGVDASGAGECAQPGFTNLSGSATDAQVPDNITVTLAGTASALAADPSDCVTSTHFAVGVTAAGVATCEAIADADVPDNITISLAATATALAADPVNCGAGSAAGGITAAGVAEACIVGPVTKAAVASNYLTSYTSGTGAFVAAQPAFTDISGSVTDAQVPDTISITGKPVTLTSTGAPTDAVILTYTAIPGIAFTPAVSTNYLIDCLIRYTSSAATTGINFAWDVPTAATISMSGFTTTTAAGAVEGFSQRADNVGSSTGSAVITVENVAILNAQLLNGANATSTTLGFTPETANSVAVIAGSTCQYRVY